MILLVIYLLTTIGSILPVFVRRKLAAPGNPLGAGRY
jgi:hypothetical protein